MDKLDVASALLEYVLPHMKFCEDFVELKWIIKFHRIFPLVSRVIQFAYAFPGFLYQTCIGMKLSERTNVRTALMKNFIF